ncbi:MAG: hypothetical protein JWN99_740 [Ilumatobacteraceae bacterium]|nr:hypothetical protein [Ilumatobacteraceae bacterium]
MGVPPKFELQTPWAKIPDHLSVGDVAGIACDADNHVWIIQRSEMSDAGPRRPRKLRMSTGEDPSQPWLSADPDDTMEPPEGMEPAPPVMEFDEDGNYLRGWGGPGEGYEWPLMEHSMHIDFQNNVWFSSAKGDAPTAENHLLKFTKDGEFLLQIGRRGGNTEGSLDKNNVQGAADLYVHPKTNELFVADGYVNRRVVVFDADTGEYLRMWGAYGNVPDDSVPRGWGGYGEAGQQYNTVHGIRVSNDDLVYVCDRRGNRIQVFELDGTYLTEAFYDRDCTRVGTTFAVAFSPDAEQTYMYVPDASSGIVRVIDRKSMEEIDTFSSLGLSEGQLQLAHSIAADSRGNVYTTEVLFNQRIQKWIVQPGTGTP